MRPILIALQAALCLANPFSFLQFDDDTTPMSFQSTKLPPCGNFDDLALNKGNGAEF